MSVVTVQLGQCGNQVGQQFYDVICSDARAAQTQTFSAASRERFFHQNKHGDLVARAVLIDMEPKVISQSLSRAARCGRWRYGESSHFSQRQGSGNNWANGFCVHGPRHREAAEDLVRRQVERCDRLAGLVAMMSVAGGTGSGVGTFLTQALRDAYPNSFILNQLTWPYRSGEVILQNYNSVLSLSRLYPLSDAILVHQNHVVHRICSRLLHIRHISFADLNRVIGQQLGSVLQPALTADSHESWSRNPVGELVSALACHPEHKLLSIASAPHLPAASLAFSTFSWPALLKHLRHTLVSSTAVERQVRTGAWTPPPPQPHDSAGLWTGAERQAPSPAPGGGGFNRSLASLLVLRGKEVFAAQTEGFGHASLYTPWLRPPEALTVWKSPLPFDKYEKSATLVSNSQALLPPLDHMVGKAWNMFASRAYIHHYTKFGISEEDFLDSFTSLEQVISSYSLLGS
ncbi:LOW QUALITY PROTEIN: tubulin delta chain [Synchiropus picturatus]